MRGSSRRTNARTALLPFLVLLLLAPSAGAQLPTQGDEDVYAAQLSTPQGSVTVDYLGTALLNVTVEDTSATQNVAGPQPAGIIYLSAHVKDRPRGWLASMGATQVVTQPGDAQEVTLNIQAGATIEDPVVEVIVEALYVAPSGERNPTNMSIMAVARPNPVVQLQLQGAPPDFQPDQRKRIPILVSNEDYYPEMIAFNVDAPEGWTVSPPSSVQLAPGEEETVYVDVKAPQDPWFRLNPTTDIFVLEAETQTAEGGRYAIGVPTPVSGSFLPGWIVGHAALLFIGIAVLARRSKRRFREGRLEKGKPEYPGLPPEKEAEFEALKITDPERAAALEAKLKERHGQRKEKWKEVHEERKEREEQLRERAQARHDALLEQQERQERRQERERERREKLRELREQKRKKQEALRKKKERLQRQLEKEREQQEEELTEEMREERERKEQRLRELRERKRQLEERNDEDDEIGGTSGS